LRAQHTAIRARQYDLLRNRLNRTRLASARFLPARLARPANDNSARPILANPLRLLAAMLRAERTRLRAIQAAAIAALRRRGTAARQVTALAHAEIATAFANRWAAIAQMPAELRAAAIAALHAEQAAALRARINYLLSRLLADERVQRSR